MELLFFGRTFGDNYFNFRSKRDHFDLLFDMLKALNSRFICDLHVLRDFLDKEVTVTQIYFCFSIYLFNLN